MQMDDGSMRKIDNDSLLDNYFIGQVNANPDLIFHVGEEVKVKGGDFRIKSMDKKMIVLEGLPGTRIVR